MLRKDFIRSASLLVGSTIVAPSISLASQSSNTKFLKKGLGYDMIREDLSVLDKFKLVRDLGFDGIEINSPTNIDINELVNAIEQTGIQVPSTVNKDHWSIPLSTSDLNIRQQIVKSINQSLEQTRILGGDTLLVVPGIVSENMPYELAYNNTMQTVTELIPLVEKSGVKIGFENVWNNFLISPVEAKYFLEQINHPLFGWYFDIGNVLRYGWPEHWIETLNSKIFKLHAKEFSRSKMDQEGLRKGFNVELNQGDVNWKQVMRKLKEIDYKGEWITLEVGGGNAAHLQKLSRQLDLIITN
ncbi:sugar phosphate isomerase/epimerase family protein [Sphingobacterium rhinopitheci]|uniref:sugar phosphate isomerase/epimerase family protein n=1 Tax=Sphingobacterium rhinopitheci TaxID=2781960 RepID=UPI001F51BCFB|nr:sugar phosphate isomerase/epimerase family protein [Sphingobacterium rhinopitheci]MCI0921356.1 sugar phosphate isomerase/epimerase [Sphingobacterium rhinopitheci]